MLMILVSIQTYQDVFNEVNSLIYNTLPVQYPTLSCRQRLLLKDNKSTIQLWQTNHRTLLLFRNQTVYIFQYINGSIVLKQQYQMSPSQSEITLTKIADNYLVEFTQNDPNIMFVNASQLSIINVQLNVLPEKYFLANQSQIEVNSSIDLEIPHILIPYCTSYILTYYYHDFYLINCKITQNESSYNVDDNTQILKQKHSDIYELKSKISQTQQPAIKCQTKFIFNETYTNITLSYKSQDNNEQVNVTQKVKINPLVIYLTVPKRSSTMTYFLTINLTENYFIHSYSFKNVSGTCKILDSNSLFLVCGNIQIDSQNSAAQREIDSNDDDTSVYIRFLTSNLDFDNIAVQLKRTQAPPIQLHEIQESLFAMYQQ